jgi:hypothetical protein
MTTENGDRILYWPVVFALVSPLLLALLWLLYALFWLPFLSDFLFFMFGSTVAGLWALSGLFSCWLIVRWAFARHWRRILSTLILPLAVLIAAMNLPLFLKENRIAIDYVRFFSQYSFYLAAVEKHPATEPRFIVWVWGEWVAPDYGVLYDETDQIASDNPSEAWKKRAESEGVIRSGYRHIVGHFYFVALK